MTDHKHHIQRDIHRVMVRRGGETREEEYRSDHRGTVRHVGETRTEAFWEERRREQREESRKVKRENFSLWYETAQGITMEAERVAKMMVVAKVSELAFKSASEAFLNVDFITAAIIYTYARATAEYVYRLSEYSHRLSPGAFAMQQVDLEKEITFRKANMDAIVHRDARDAKTPPGGAIATADACTDNARFLGAQLQLDPAAARKTIYAFLRESLFHIDKLFLVANNEAGYIAATVAAERAAEIAAERASDEAAIAAENALRGTDEWANSHGKPSDTFPGLGE